MSCVYEAQGDALRQRASASYDRLQVAVAVAPVGVLGIRTFTQCGCHGRVLDARVAAATARGAPPARSMRLRENDDEDRSEGRQPEDLGPHDPPQPERCLVRLREASHALRLEPQLGDG